MDIILETKDLTKTYKAGNNHINAVDHTSICVERGDFVTIVGKSGSGKSTLLHLIGGLDYPTSGEVWIDNDLKNHHWKRIEGKGESRSESSPLSLSHSFSL